MRIFIDGGFDEARRVVRELLDERERQTARMPIGSRTPQTRLQELLQGHGHPLPEYEVWPKAARMHIKQFQVELPGG